MEISFSLLLIFIFLLKITQADDGISCNLSPDNTTIAATTDYQLNIFFGSMSGYPNLTNMTLNFSSSDIVPMAATMAICNSTFPSLVLYNGCSCQNSVCFINLNVQPTQFLYINMGFFVNPSAIRAQTISLTLNFNSTTFPVSSKSLTIGTESYIPGLIYNQSLLQGSLKRAAVTNYSIIFNINDKIPQNGQIILTFPSATSLMFISNVYWKSYNDTTETSISFTNTSQILTLSTLFPTNALVPNTTGHLSIRIDSIQNPSTIINTTSIIIQTANSQGGIIDQASTGLIVQASIPGDIQITSIGPLILYSSAINLETRLFISIQPEVIFPRGGFIAVQFPSQFSFNLTAVGCETQMFGLYPVENMQAFCSLKNSTLFVNNTYYPSLTSQIIFVVIGVINPNSTAPTSTFFFQTFDDQSTVICQSYNNYSYSATPGSVVLNGPPNKTASLAGSPFNLTIGIKTTDNFPAGGYVSLYVPLEQGILANATPICGVLFNGSYSTPSCFSLNLTTGVKIFIKEWCSNGNSVCAAGMTASIYLNYTLINPYFISQLALPSCNITTLGTDQATMYDQISSSVILMPQTTPIPITFISFYRYSSNYTGDIDSYDITFQITNYFSSYSGSVQVFFPQNAAYILGYMPIQCYLVDSSGNNLSRQCQATYYSGGSSVNYIILNNVCESSSCTTSNITMRIKNVRNPLSTQPLNTLNSTNFYGVQTLTLDNKIISFSTTTNISGVAILPLPFQNVLLQTSSSTTNQISTYTITFQTNVEIPQNGLLVLSFPNEIAVSNDSVCQISVNNTANSQMNCQIFSKNCTLTHSLDPSSFLFNTSLQLTITKFSNPRSLAPTSNFTLSSKTKDSYIIQQSSFSITMTTSYEMNNAAILRSNIFLNNQTLVNIDFTTVANLSTNDKIQMSFSIDQLVAGNISAIVVQSLNTNPTINLTFSLIQSDPNYLGISFSDPSCTPCLSNQTLNYSVIGFSNIGTTKQPTLSNKIQINDTNGFSIEQKTSLLFIRPALAAGNLSNLNISFSNMTTGADTNLTISFLPQDSVVSGILVLNFPTEFLFVSSLNPSNLCNVSLSATFLICSLTLFPGPSLGKYVQSITINAISIAANTMTQLTIFNTLKNQPSNQPVSSDSTILFSTLDNNSNTIDSGSLSANAYIPTQFNNFKQISFSRSVNSVAANTDLIVSFETVNEMAQGSNFSIILPGNQIAITINSTCYGFYLNGYHPIMCSFSDASGDLMISFQEFCSLNGSNLSYCQADLYFKVKITNLLNNLFVPDNKSYSLQLMSLEGNGVYYYEKRTSSLLFDSELQMSNFANFSLFLNDSRISAPVSFNINFSLSTSIPQNGIVFMNLIANLFGFSSGYTCTFSLKGSNQNVKSCSFSTMTGNFNDIQISSINLTGICLNSADCAPGNTFLINFQATNPLFFSNSFLTNSIQLYAQTTTQNGISYFDYNASIIEFTSYDLDNYFQVTRSNAILNQPNTLRLDLILPGKLIANSTVNISLPKSQILFPTSSTIQIWLNSPISKNFTSFQVSNDSDHYFISFNQTFCSNYCPSATNLSLTLQQISNPMVLIYTNINSFLIKAYYQSQSQFIYVSNNGVYANPELLVSSLLNISINRTSSYLNQINNLVLGLSVPSEVGRNLSNNNFVVQFPDRLVYLIDNTLQSLNLLLFVPNGSSVNVSSQSTLIKSNDSYGNCFVSSLEINGFCNGFCSLDQIITLQINQIKNPSVFFNNINNSTISLFVLSSDSSTILNKVTYNSQNIVPNIQIFSIDVINCTRNISTPNTTVDVLLDFELVSYVLEGSILEIDIPKTQIILTSSTFCINGINNNSIPCSLNSNSSYYMITFQEYCAAFPANCSATSLRFSFYLKNCQNPLKTPLKTVDNTIRISAFSSRLEIYQISQGTLFLTPDIYQFYLNGVTVNRNSSVAGNFALYTFQVNLPQTLANSVVLIILFPEYLGYLDPSSPSICSSTLIGCSSVLFTTSQSISQIIVNNFCASGNTCLQNQIVSLAIQVKNQGNTYDYQSKGEFTLVVESSDQSLEIAEGVVKASSLPAITPGLFLNVAIQAGSYQVGARNNWNLSFTISNDFLPIDQNGSIVLVFPNNVTFDSLSLCSSDIVNYNSVFCKITLQTNIITISHSLTAKISQGSIILVQVLNIINPSSMKPTVYLTLTSYGLINGSIVKFDELTNGPTFQCITPGAISQVNIQRNNVLLGYEVTLLFNFTTSNKNSANGLILINILNSDEVNFSTITTLSCQNFFDNSFFNCSRNGNYLQISNLSAYSGNNTWVILVKGLKNQFYVDNFIGNQNSFTIETMTFDNYEVDYKGSGLHGTPVLEPGVINITTMNRTSDVITDEILLEAQIATTNPVYQNQSLIRVVLPFEFLLSSNSFNFRCSASGVDLACSSQLFWDGKSLNDLSVLNINQLNQTSNIPIVFSTGTTNTFFVNPASQKIIIQSLIVVSQNVFGLLDQGLASSTTFFNQLKPQMITSCSISCFDCAINQTTDLYFRFTINHIFLRNIWIQIQIPGNITIPTFQLADKKCQGLIGLDTNIDCYLENNVIWISDSFLGIRNPGLIYWKLKDFDNPQISGNYTGFNYSIFYNQSYWMDYTDEDIVLQINSNNNSFNCDTYCQTCTQNISECLSCFFPSYYPFYDPIHHQCLNQCPNGTFLSSQMTCEACYNTCLSCDGPTNSDCLSCQFGLLFVDGFCTSSCPDNTTKNGSYCSNNTCLGGCELCGQNKSYCQSCLPGYFFDNATKTCSNSTQCTGSYFFQGGQCQKCNMSCLTCEYNSSNCTSCVDYFNKDYLFVSGTNGTGICQDKCPEHYYAEAHSINSTFPFITVTDYICRACDQTCLTCQNSSDTSCLSCNKTSSQNSLLEYGVCVANCTSDTIEVNQSTCVQNCSNSKCYKCESQNTTICIACQAPLEYLINGQCNSEEDICSDQHQYISSTNPYKCSQCDVKCQTCSISATNCLSCYNSLTSPNLTSNFPFLYLNQCVPNCPAGFSPDYGDNMVCKDFICSKPCKTCISNSSTCDECLPDTPYSYQNYCYSNCPADTITDESLNVCLKKDSQIPNIWATWVVISVFMILLAFFILSMVILKNSVILGSSVICLLQITEFLSKLFIFGFLFQLQELPACVFSFLSLMNNSVLSMIFQTLYIGVLEIHLRSFSLFKSNNSKFYYFVLAGMLIFGINFAFAFSSGLFRFVKSEFENNSDYSKGLNRMLLFGLVFAVMQFCVDCFILNKYNPEYDVFHLAYMNLIMNVIIYGVLAGKKLMAVLVKSKKLINKNK